MNKLYQIIAKNGLDGKWQFVAHGARYNLNDANQTIESYKARGIPARKLLI